MSNSIVGLLDGDGLDDIYHVIELVLLGFDPKYPLCSEIDAAMTLLCLCLSLGPEYHDFRSEPIMFSSIYESS